MWKVLQQRIGLPPSNSPKALSFWMANSLPAVVHEKHKLKLLKTRSMHKRYVSVPVLELADLLGNKIEKSYCIVQEERAHQELAARVIGRCCKI